MPTVEGIAAVQGRGEHSPVEGRLARIEGVVTLVWPGGGGFVQALVDDGDAQSANGIFVLPQTGSPALEPGLHLRAIGKVAESGEGARLTSLVEASIEPLGVLPLPAAVRLEALPATAAGWESLEGMRVHLDLPLTVSGNETLTRFGEVVLAAGGRLVTPTELVLPGAEARALERANAARRILLDDGSPRTDPRHIAWLSAPLDPQQPLRAGSVLEGLVGVIDERYGGYRLHAVAAPERIRQAPRPAAPERMGDLRIVGLNLLNLFNGDGEGGGFPTQRGARTVEAYRRQLAKHVALIQALDPQVLALQEVENDGEGPRSAIADLARALDAAQPGARWVAVRPEQRPGTDAIRVALLYRADRLQAVGRPAVLDGAPFDWGSRPPLAQSFRFGESPPFTVVSLHFKSKGGCEEARGADRDQGDGQGCFNARRLDSVRALAAWIENDPTGAGDRVALIGDFNAYAMEDPMRYLRGRGWIDPFADRGLHSFVFRGQAGRLDHALLSPALRNHLRQAAKWAVNSDESPWFGYDGGAGRHAPADPWRASDHDPLLLDLEFAAD